MVSLPLLLAISFIAPPGTGKGTQQVQRITLSRGSTVAWNQPKSRYWDVREAELSGAGITIPNQFVLSASPNGYLLMNFGLLDLALGPAVKIKKATLVLTSADGPTAPLQSVGLVKESWVTPQLASLGSRATKKVPEKDLKKGEEQKPAEVVYGANTRTRDGITTPWKGGGFGTQSLQSINFKSTTQENVIRIEGLESAVQSMHDHWWENTGFALKFSKEVNFWTSLSKFYKPALELEYEIVEPTQANPAISGIKVDGDQVSVGTSGLAQPGTIEWRSVTGQVQSQPVTPGAPGATFTIRNESKAAQPNLPGHFVLMTDQPDSAPADNAVEFYPGATTVSNISPQLARWWNDNIAKQSRFSFAPSGALGYVAAGGAKSSSALNGLEEIRSAFNLPKNLPQTDQVWKDRYPGIFGYGETRTDVQLMPGMVLPPTPEINPLLDDLQLEQNGELATSDVAWINSRKVGVPNTLLLRASDSNGNPLSNTAVKFIGFDSPVQLDALAQTDQGTESVTGTTGIVSLPKLKSPPQDSNFVHQGFAIEVKIPDPVNGDRIARRVLKGWQLADLAARTPNEAVVLDLKFQISRAPINPNVNLALGKLITDSAKSFPAQLVALVDGNPSTSYNFPAEKQSWVEIDLGRDRVVGAIQIEADSMPKSFQILVRNTGDKLEDSIPWATEPDFEWTKQFQATPKTISNGKPVMYFYSPIQVRYIRLVNRSGGAGKISGITLMPRVTAVSQ